MPKKPSGGHRGFAFVEFASEDQAKVCDKFITTYMFSVGNIYNTSFFFQSAMATFGTDSHFMGRRLNIEYAKSL